MKTEDVNSLLKQLMALVPKITVAAGDPDTDDDESDTGGNGIFKSGDIWINSGDAGVFICIDPSEGAADWDEVAKA